MSSRLFERACVTCIIYSDVTFSVGLRFLGPVLVVLANGLIALVVYMYLAVLVPRYVVSVCGLAATCPIVAIGIYLLFNILFNYWSCVLIKPGFPGHYLPSPDDLEEGIDFCDYGEVSA